MSATIQEREAAAEGHGEDTTATCPLTSRSCGLTQRTDTAELEWAATPVHHRLKVLHTARHAMASRADAFAAAISPQLARTPADTLVTELLPLLDACRFLERNAEKLLAPRRLGRSGRPLWLFGIHAELHREPLGHILLIAPANFPLFLPGVQALQALAAGNTVTWKPGTGGAAIAELFARMMRQAGLPANALTITNETVEAAQHALAADPDKVIFTGSSASGQSVLAALAPTATPAVVELSGADAVLVMPSADLKLVARAVAFGLRLNGGAVCMSPRRLFASKSTLAELRPLLEAELAAVSPVTLSTTTAAHLQHLLEDAVSQGGIVQGKFDPEAQRPLTLVNASAHMQIARSDIFAPVISLLESESMLHVLEQYAQCPYALTASIFCGRSDEKKARSLATMLKAGTVLINDIIAPTADPRVPFGGRGASGFGVTRGAEGLLEMTAIKTLLVRRGGAMKHLDATHDGDAPIFTSLIAVLHGKGFSQRFTALRQLIQSAGKKQK